MKKAKSLNNATSLYNSRTNKKITASQLLFGLAVLGVALVGCGQEGELNRPCYPNDTCNAGLICESGRCVSESSPGGQGEKSGPCYPNDTCNSGLICVEGFCVSESTPEAREVQTKKKLSPSQSEILSTALSMNQGKPGSDKNYNGLYNRLKKQEKANIAGGAGATGPQTGYTNENATAGVTRFKITPETYDPKSNLNRVCENTFGKEWRLVAWSDLTRNQHRIDEIMAGSEFGERYNNLAVTFKGRRRHSGTRYYFVTRFDHKKPGYYLSHANIQNHLIDLGSWKSNRLVFCTNLGVNQKLGL